MPFGLAEDEVAATKNRIVRMRGPHRTQRPFNVVTLGDPGQGKSSFGATLVKAFNPRASAVPLVPTSMDTAAQSSFTRKSTFFSIPGTNIQVRDLWGWRNDGTLSLSVFENILNGQCPDNVEDSSFKVTAPDPKAVIDAVLFFVPPRDYAIERDAIKAFWQKMQPYHAKCKELKRRVVFVVNRIDEISPNSPICARGKTLRKEVTLNKDWLQIQDAIMAELKSSPFPCVTYIAAELQTTGGTESNAVIEEFALKVLEAAIASDAPDIFPLNHSPDTFVGEKVGVITYDPTTSSSGPPPKTVGGARKVIVEE